MRRKTSTSFFVVSLDFELFWGMYDKKTLIEYGPSVVGERTAIPRILEYFKDFHIHATWATVGMLMARNKKELLALLPPERLRPKYSDMRQSSYRYLETMPIGETEKDDPYHYGKTLLTLIMETPHQEIGNHTFSHYYCVDSESSNRELFATDLDTFNRIAETYGIVATSMVFPRNQTNSDALTVCVQKGITAYRGNEDHFLYRSRKDSSQSLFIRALRLIDHYINISGYHTYVLPITRSNNTPVNIPSSRFLRPWNSSLRILEPLRLFRIKRAMTHAAKRGEVFHLWWHPHNFGINQDKNFKNLEKILNHYKKLNEKYGMQSASMHELVDVIKTSTK